MSLTTDEQLDQDEIELGGRVAAELFTSQHFGPQLQLDDAMWMMNKLTPEGRIENEIESGECSGCLKDFMLKEDLRKHIPVCSKRK